MKLLQKIRYSLSLRLLLMFLVAAILITVLFQGMLGAAIGHHVRTQIVPHLQQYTEYLLQDIGNPPNKENAQRLTARLPFEIVIDAPDDRWQSNPVPDWVTQQASYNNTFTTRQGQLIRYNFEREGVVLSYQTGTGGDDTAAGTVYIWGKGWQRPNHRRGGLLLGVAVLLLLLAGLYYLIRRLFKPIQTIRNGVQLIGSGELSHRITPVRNDELGELSVSINHMADDIEQMLESKRELLLAISHELRSPITRAKVSLALLDESTVQKNINRDLNEMETMISELLEAERLKGRHSVLNQANWQLNEMVTAVVQEQFPDAPLQLTLAGNLPPLQLDAVRIKLVVRNLLDNALKYQQQSIADKPVALSTQLRDGKVCLEVTDHGPGIAAEHLEHLTEPFYRTDASRNRKTGGFGLGLYLVRLIVEAHGGELMISSEVDAGTTVEVFLPTEE